MPFLTTEFAEITQNNGHYAIQGHKFWYQSKAHMRLVFNSPGRGVPMR